jgi:hypothetical protein
MMRPTWTAAGATVGHAVYLRPGRACTHRWRLLEDWGYELREPGEYSIVGLPQVGSEEMAPDDERVPSNTAAFRIIP